MPILLHKLLNFNFESLISLVIDILYTTYNPLLAVLFLPIKALGIVIFSHIRSLISRPESGCAIALTTVAISVLVVKFKSSNPEKEIQL